MVSWCFEPSQPQRITSGLNTNFNLAQSTTKDYIRAVISGLRENFTNRYIVDRTNKAEIDEEVRVRKRGVSGEFIE